MATPNDTRLTLSGELNPPGGRGELIAIGQMSMAIDHGGQRTMPTDGAGSSISGWPSGTWEEATMGAWTVHPLYRAPPGVGGASEAKGDDAPFSCQTAGQSTA